MILHDMSKKYRKDTSINIPKTKKQELKEKEEQGQRQGQNNAKVLCRTNASSNC